MQSPIVINEMSIENYTETPERQFTNPQTYDPKLLPEGINPKDATQFEHKLMSLPMLAPDKITLLQQKDTFCNDILTHLHCNPHEKYFMDSIGILHRSLALIAHSHL